MESFVFRAVFYFVLCAVASESCAEPIERSKLSRSVPRPCVTAAINLGLILDFVDGLIPEDSPFTLQNVAISYTGWDLFDPEERENFFCRFEGISTLSELLRGLQDTGLDYQFLRLAYDYFVVAVRAEKARLLWSLEKPNLTEDRQQFILDQLQLARDVEAAGLLDLDPEGTALYGTLMAIFDNKDKDEVPQEPLSHLPLDTQCNQITDDVRKVWYAIKKKHSNVAGVQRTRDLIKAWTGIEWSGHNDVQEMVCQLMELAVTDGLDGVYDWMDTSDIFDHVLQQSYPLMVWFVDDLQKTFSKTLNKYQGDPEAAEGSVVLFYFINQLLDNLREIGIFGLEDDFNF